MAKVTRKSRNLLEITPDMYNTDKWEIESLGKYFMYYALPQNVINVLKNVGTVAGTVYLKTGGEHYSREVFAITPEKNKTVSTEYRLLLSDGTSLNFSQNVSNWRDVYLCIGYTQGVDPANKQLLINSLFQNFNIMLNEGSSPLPYEPYGTIWEPCAVKQYHASKTIERTDTLPTTINADGNALLDYRIYGASGGVGDDSSTAYGYEVDISVSDGTTSTTTPIYIGDTPLGEDEYVDYGEQKVYRRNPDNIFDYTKPISWTSISIGQSSFSPSQPKTEYSFGATSELYTRISFYNGGSRLSASSWATSALTATAPANCTQIAVEFRNKGYTAVTEEQKQTMHECVVNVGSKLASLVVPTDPPAPLPEIPTVDGTTIIDYDETPKPSQMYVKYNSRRGWEPCTEYVRRNGVWVPQP